MEPQQIDPELQMLINNKEGGYNFRERRQEEWRENYTLYRDRVQVNRLTQRQSVNIPLMKTQIRSLLKDVDDMPVIYFQNLDNDKGAELFQNEYWKWILEQNSMEVQDIVDKKQVFMFGRSFDQWQIADGSIKCSVQDPQDLLVSRYTNPSDLNTSRFLIHTHIFRPLSQLEQNPEYDQKKVKDLKMWYASKMGLLKAEDNKSMLVEKNKKMSDMGLTDVDDPVLGETYVELSQHFVYRKEEGDEEEKLYLYVEVENNQILMKKRLEDVIGKTKDNYWRNHYPYVSWADDVERQDFWTDGVADIIRTPNKVLNTWFSQLVENRTMRSFGMHYYDGSANEAFSPQTFNPVPWGWYKVPGKPSEVIQKVDIPDLSESLDEMQFVMNLVERASGATSTQQGVQTERKITLGEVQLALGEAKERVKGMSKFYTPAWKRRAEIFLKLIEAAPEKLDAVKIYKKGKNTDDVYEREITPKDWMTKSGYQTRIWTMDEKQNKNTEDIQKLSAVKALIPMNPKLDEVLKMKMLEFADLTPEQVNEIMDYERQPKTPQLGGQAGPLVQTPVAQPPMPVAR